MAPTVSRIVPTPPTDGRWTAARVIDLSAVLAASSSSREFVLFDAASAALGASSAGDQ
jgi:hypothetical protein